MRFFPNVQVCAFLTAPVGVFALSSSGCFVLGVYKLLPQHVVGFELDGELMFPERVVELIPFRLDSSSCNCVTKYCTCILDLKCRLKWYCSRIPDVLV